VVGSESSISIPKPPLPAFGHSSLGWTKVFFRLFASALPPATPGIICILPRRRPPGAAPSPASGRKASRPKSFFISFPASRFRESTLSTADSGTSIWIFSAVSAAGVEVPGDAMFSCRNARSMSSSPSSSSTSSFAFPSPFAFAFAFAFAFFFFFDFFALATGFTGSDTGSGSSSSSSSSCSSRSSAMLRSANKLGFGGAIAGSSSLSSNSSGV
jgi:hypothetical protein